MTGGEAVRRKRRIREEGFATEITEFTEKKECAAREIIIAVPSVVPTSCLQATAPV
jgi:hypothetical protein|tara:strand:+ start:3428 stop:3595 length:168 start_codon:yes stop_codon:yes gene_type:complete